MIGRPRTLLALVSILSASPMRAQAPRVGGRVVVQVAVTIADDEVPRRPVSGLTLGFIRSATDTALTVTDKSGAATVLLTPGQYRVVSLVPVQWKGLRYSWNTAVVVRDAMPVVDLGSSEAAISRIVTVTTASDGEAVSAQPSEQPNDMPRPTWGDKSHSSGFFVGLGIEGNGLAANGSGSAETGGGTGLILGYGFNPRWALYGDLSGAIMNATDGGTFTLAHLDLGARVHFRTGPNVVVPFLQFGLVGRTIAGTTVNGDNVSISGGGVSFGGGFNIHFAPSVALSTAVTWSVGTFNNLAVDNIAIGGLSANATTARAHLGIIWFP